MVFRAPRITIAQLVHDSRFSTSFNRSSIGCSRSEPAGAAFFSSVFSSKFLTSRLHLSFFSLLWYDRRRKEANAMADHLRAFPETAQQPCSMFKAQQDALQ